MYKLKILIDGGKPYGDWDLKGVFGEVLKQPNYKYLSDIPRFNLNELPPLEYPFSEERLKIVIGDLRDTVQNLVMFVYILIAL